MLCLNIGLIMIMLYAKGISDLLGNVIVRLALILPR